MYILSDMQLFNVPFLCIGAPFSKGSSRKQFAPLGANCFLEQWKTQ